MSKKKQSLAANLKRRKWGLVLPIHSKFSFFFAISQYWYQIGPYTGHSIALWFPCGCFPRREQQILRKLIKLCRTRPFKCMEPCDGALGIAPSEVGCTGVCDTYIYIHIFIYIYIYVYAVYLYIYK